MVAIISLSAILAIYVSIIFCNMNELAKNLSASLAERGIPKSAAREIFSRNIKEIRRLQIDERIPVEEISRKILRKEL